MTRAPNIKSKGEKKMSLRSPVRLARMWSALLALIVVMVGGTALAETNQRAVLREGKIVIGIHNRSPWGFRDEARARQRAGIRTCSGLPSQSSASRSSTSASPSLVP